MSWIKPRPDQESSQGGGWPQSEPVKKYLLAILGVWFVLYGSFTLARPPLLDDADSVHAEVAREMIVRQDWVTLYANGIRYLEKAPLMYWSMAASYKLLGVSHFAARLPLALYALALFYAAYALGKCMFGTARAGLYAALALETSFGIFIFTRILLPDVMVCLWSTLAALFFWRSLAGQSACSDCPVPNPRTSVGFALCCAMSVLSKGLIGLVFPLGMVVVYLAVTRRLSHLRRWHPVLGVLIFLLFAAPWHIVASLANPSEGHPAPITLTGGHIHVADPTPGNVHGFAWFYFVNEHLLRYLDARVPRDYDTVPLVLFWALVLVWLFPWCVFAVRALVQAPWRRWYEGMRHPQREPVPESATLLLVVWAAVVLVFFSFSTRQEYYVLPALPALAVLAGGWLARADRESQNEAAEPRFALRTAQVLMAFAGVCALAATWFAVVGRAPAPGADLYSLLSKNPGEYALSFGHFLDLNPQAMGAFRLPLIITAISLTGGMLANLLFRRKGKPFAANWCLVGGMAGFLVAAHFALNTFAPVLSSYTLAQAIQPEYEGTDLIVLNGEYEAGSTLSYYLKTQVHILNGHSANLWYGSFFRDAPQIFETEQSLNTLWNSDRRIFLWTPVGQLPAISGQTYLIGEVGGKQVVSNRPNHSGAIF